MSQFCTFNETLGPLRVGALHDFRDGFPIEAPGQWNAFKNQYLFFLDHDTKWVQSLAGHSRERWFHDDITDPWQDTQEATDFTPQSLFGNIAGNLSLGCEVGGDAGAAAGHVVGGTQQYVMGRFRDWTVQGWVVDTSEIAGGIMFPAGSGGIDCEAPVGVPQSDACAAKPPWRVTVDIDVTKFGTGSFLARLFDQFETTPDLHADGTHMQPYSPYLVCPVTRSYVVPNLSWATHYKTFPTYQFYELTPAWCLAQDPPIPLNDVQVPLYGAPARVDPAAPAPYFPAGIVFNSVTVNRPNGLRPSDWVSSDTGKLTVTEASDETVFHVATAGAFAVREFVTPWRAWCTPGDPHYSTEAYEWTKHDAFAAGYDVFGWQHHGWLLVQVDSPDAATFTLKVEGVQLQVDDPHDGSNPGLTEHPLVATYTFPVAAGSSSVYVDLLYPNEGGPFYYGRVDKLTLSGFAVGDTHLRGLTLAAREHGYFKADLGAPVQRHDYDVVVLANDGAFTLGDWPDQMVKTETGAYGGGVRSIQIAYDGPTIADAQYFLETFFMRIGRLEGYTVNWDAGAENAALRDPYGVSMGPELAQWIQSVVPFARYTPGVAYKPGCMPRVHELQITNILTYKFLARFPLMASIEQLVTMNGHRAPAGVTAAARRVDNGRVYTAITDPSGYAVIVPVPGEADYDPPA